MIDIREAFQEDADLITPHLRREDLQEVRAVSTEPVVEVIRRSVLLSDQAFLATNGQDQPICLWGVGEVASNGPAGRLGVIWLVGTPLVQRNKVAFLRASRRFVDKTVKEYDALANWVDGRNELHIQWLEWLGFHRVATDPEYGVENRTFHLYQRTK